ncbi:purine transporter [Verticillium alfalfae VaMs.102]|uniref:Purine transporter n=1 Tax=Verticillium alfalfae (strain VaMs.102 / ATCC MYA-4576 / FGSC 10136) TaxID=526221 RepID=C9SBT0_VERA1|nr:purine transporter [Verticillium alfalfae VaMs.102]EEY15814.1 purine transporter [Verticillium alfalfae VaMs.102]
MAWTDTINNKVARSRAGRWFKLDGCGHPRERKGSKFLTELRAGLVTFFAMAYILAVNSSIVSDSGGTCVCNSTPDDPICVENTEYLLCKTEIRRDLVTATAAISALSTFSIFIEGFIFIAQAEKRLPPKARPMLYLDQSRLELETATSSSTRMILLIGLATGGRLVPHNKDQKDPWTWHIPGGLLPGWIVRLFKGKKDFWRPYPGDDESNTAPAAVAAPADEPVAPFKGAQYEDRTTSSEHGGSILMGEEKRVGETPAPAQPQPHIVQQDKVDREKSA